MLTRVSMIKSSKKDICHERTTIWNPPHMTNLTEEDTPLSMYTTLTMGFHAATCSFDHIPGVCGYLHIWKKQKVIRKFGTKHEGWQSVPKNALALTVLQQQTSNNQAVHMNLTISIVCSL